MSHRYRIPAALLFVVSCGTNSETAKTPSAQPLHTTVQQAEVAVKQQPLSEAVVDLPPAGVPTDIALWVKPKRDTKSFEVVQPIKMGKRCTFVEGVCDPSTMVLTLAGSVLDFRAKSSDTESPFGDWKALSVYTNRKAQDSIFLRIQHETEFEHLRATIDNGVVVEVESLRFPRTIEKTIPNTLDLDGDGNPDVLRLTCEASRPHHPTACNGFTLWINNKSIHKNTTTNAGPEKIDVLAFRHNGISAIRVSTNWDDADWPLSNITILAMKDNSYKIQYENEIDGAVTFHDNGSFTVEEIICDRPAQLKYNDSGDTTVLSFGRERYRKNKHLWDGKTITNKVSKGWKKRRSKCQTEGRCPYVYAGKSDTKLGEILTNFVGTKRWKDQSIQVPRDLVENGNLSILVSEEKLDEVTHIDSVWLMVGDTKFLPNACPFGLCSQDRETKSLGTGDSIRLEFRDIPSEGEIRFFANGYYLYN